MADVNECEAGTNNCSQLCVNTIGSYTCECVIGYELDTNGLTCNSKFIQPLSFDLLCYNMLEIMKQMIFHLKAPNHYCNYSHVADVNECELGTHNCSQICIDSIGSYTCDCDPGYEMDSDGRTCNSK